MGVRGARQGPIPHQTQRSHWVGLNGMSCFLGAFGSAFGCWGFEWRQWLAPGGVVTAGLAITTPYSPGPWSGWASPNYGAGRCSLLLGDHRCVGGPDSTLRLGMAHLFPRGWMKSVCIFKYIDQF